MIEKKLKDLGQDHIANLLMNDPSPLSRELLARDLEGLDTDLFNRLLRGEYLYHPPVGSIEPEEVIPASFAASEEALVYRKEGERLLRDGKVAALLVAGGQGSRLGFDGPKGMVGVTPVKRKSLFLVFAEKIRAEEKRSQCRIPLFIMTSRENNQDTQDYFQENRFFGLEPEQIRFFVQGMLPSVTPEGRFIISEQGGLSMNPDGHGGTFKALRDSGSLEYMREAAIEEIFYFQVDNPLVKLCDPLFLGLHRLSRAQMSSKVARKVSFEEKVGVLAKVDGKTHLVEYSDMDDSLRYAVASDGTMLHWAGNIAVHVIRRDFIEKITSHGMTLPFHRARKAILSMGADGKIGEIEGIKFETFLFDALPLAEKTVTLEVRRDEEFAPVKNRTGNDSLESSIILQNDLFRSWFERAGRQVKPGISVEISPLFAGDEEELKAKAPRLPRVIDTDTYLE